MSASMNSGGGGFPPQVTALRLRLLANGYRPVPVTAPEVGGKSAGKRPIMQGWQERCLAADAAEVRRWAATQPRCTNTGIATGVLSGLDLDVADPRLADRLERLARGMLGPTPLRRVGNAPKALLLYRNANPLPKMATAELWMPDGTKAQVEALGAGQQFVAYGVHPDTRREYEWPDSGPDAIPVDDLPVLEEQDVREYLGAAERLLREAGGRTEAERKAAANGHAEPEPPPQQGRRQANGRATDTAEGSDFFRAVNQAALADLDAWVPQLFPRAKKQPGTGAWRVTSKDLGRGFEEDLSIHSSGIQDFGPREGMTAIDAVMEFGGAPKPQDAAFTLCEWLGLDPADLGWQPTKQKRGKQKEEEQPQQRQRQQPEQNESWPEPIDILSSQATGAPELRPEHLPGPVYDFAADTAPRMGVDPSSVALAELVALASVAPDTWTIQPKQHDHRWQEQPRLWGGIVGDPSVLKSPVLRECTRPIDALDAQARKQHQEDLARHKRALKAWKDGGSDPDAEPTAPKLHRYLIEGTTTEAISEALRDDPGGTQTAPSGKVLCRQDEMSEWLASFDRYRNGGGGSADRGAYLRLFNGGRYVYDRIGRGSFAIPNWSACLLGGIQPDMIRRIAKDAAEDGLLQRFCFCVPSKQTRGLDRAPDTRVVARYEALFPALAALRPALGPDGIHHRPVVLDGDAHAYRREIDDLAAAMSAMPDTSTRLKAALGKWPGIFARLVLVFHLVGIADARARGVETPPVEVATGETAKRVAAYMREILLPHLLRAEDVMFSTPQAGHAAWIAGFILSHGKTRVAARDVVNAYGPLRAPEQRQQLESVMASLVTVGWLDPEPQDNPARHTTAWAVNPAVHSVFAARAEQERERRRKAQWRN